MSKVFTIFGDLPREILDTKDIVGEGPNDRSIATEWYLNEDYRVGGELMSFTFTYQDGQPDKTVWSTKGTLVRRDATVSILTPNPQAQAQGYLKPS